MSQTHIQIQTDDFDIGAETRLMRNTEGEVGALVTFTGLVRDLAGDPLETMFLEHYPGMTEKCLESIAKQARERWSLLDIRIIHRVGRLLKNDQIVFVAVSSAHRVEAFAACEFIMDYLKKDAPFWKKEQCASGERWVEQKNTDLAAADRWHQD